MHDLSVGDLFTFDDMFGCGCRFRLCPPQEDQPFRTVAAEHRCSTHASGFRGPITLRHELEVTLCDFMDAMERIEA